MRRLVVGTFRDIAIEAGAALSVEAKPQAGMGVSIGDYNRDGNPGVVKTDFAGDTGSLYTNLADASFEDRTCPGGLGVNSRLLGRGVGFFDMDNDGWLDIPMSNGHVYREVDKSKADLKIRRAQVSLSQSAHPDAQQPGSRPALYPDSLFLWSRE